MNEARTVSTQGLKLKAIHTAGGVFVDIPLCETKEPDVVGKMVDVERILRELSSQDAVQILRQLHRYFSNIGAFSDIPIQTCRRRSPVN